MRTVPLSCTYVTTFATDPRQMTLEQKRLVARPVSSASQSTFPESIISEDEQGTGSEISPASQPGARNPDPGRTLQDRAISNQAQGNGNVGLGSPATVVQSSHGRPSYVSRNKHIRVVIKVRAWLHGP
jgi:hypothetical protein